MCMDVRGSESACASRTHVRECACEARAHVRGVSGCAIRVHERSARSACVRGAHALRACARVRVCTWGAQSAYVRKVGACERRCSNKIDVQFAIWRNIIEHQHTCESSHVGRWNCVSGNFRRAPRSCARNSSCRQYSFCGIRVWLCSLTILSTAWQSE